MPPATGLFGKLPAHGDFVRRNLPASFVTPWDAWLCAGIAAAEQRLGEGWAAAWEGAPPWRFRLAPGTCGPEAAAGVVVTSRDQVGRRFPLTLAAVDADPGLSPPAEWYAVLEAVAEAARGGEFDADALAARLPGAPEVDPEATVDGRSLFWTAAGVARAMPAASEFRVLLGLAA